MMKLFFETAQQANSFLLMTAAGFICAAVFPLAARTKIFRPVMDALAVIACGALALFVLLYQNDQILRIYHFLGLISGVLICRGGIGRILEMAMKKMKKILKNCIRKRRK